MGLDPVLARALKPAVFLDRDGVLIEDVDRLLEVGQVRLLSGVAEALTRFDRAGFVLVVVTNQPVIARGLATEAQVQAVHQGMARRILEAGGPALRHVYFCPHHPEATLPAYRVDCDCRKPRPGLLRRAARELGLEFGASFLVGDRLTDIQAGIRAGVRTVLVESGMHERPRIVTREPVEPGLHPDHQCADLSAAASWILAHR